MRWLLSLLVHTFPIDSPVTSGFGAVTARDGSKQYHNCNAARQESPCAGYLRLLLHRLILNGLHYSIVITFLPILAVTAPKPNVTVESTGSMLQ